MREILFRGKRKDNGEWLEGFAIFADNKAFILNNAKVEVLNGYNEYRMNFTLKEVIPSTVGQYTGLTDKNGDKIFDSDVVDILTENEEVGFVTYDEGCFFVKADGFSVDFRNNINGNDLLVIGNIHDNPEILKWG